MTTHGPPAVATRSALAAGLLLAMATAAMAEPGWTVTRHDDVPLVIYGDLSPAGEAYNDELNYIYLSCLPSGQDIEISFTETNEEVPPSSQLPVTARIGSREATVPGRTSVIMELTGAPDLTFALPADSPLIAAMADGQSLSVSIDGWQETTPLDGIAGPLAALRAYCSR